MDQDDLVEAAAVASGAKPWWRSRTIWGAGIAGASILGGMAFGFQLDPETQRVVAEQTTAFATAGVALGGTLLAIYGRAKAAKAVTLTQKGADRAEQG